MKLSGFTDKKLVDLGIAARTKDDLISRMVDLLGRSPKIKDKAAFLRDVRAREALVPTGVGYGVGFPHAKSDAATSVVFAVGRADTGIDFEALDKEPVRLVFLIAAPKGEEPSRVYLNLMARLSFLMKDQANRKRLLTTDSVADVMALLDSID